MNRPSPTYQSYARGGLERVQRSEFNSLGPKDDKRVKFKARISGRLPGTGEAFPHSKRRSCK
jgi:hypothetical protein